jgi:hypothetical protein
MPFVAAMVSSGTAAASAFVTRSPARMAISHPPATGASSTGLTIVPSGVTVSTGR